MKRQHVKISQQEEITPTTVEKRPRFQGPNKQEYEQLILQYALMFDRHTWLEGFTGNGDTEYNGHKVRELGADCVDRDNGLISCAVDHVKDTNDARYLQIINVLF